jgi:MFS family permease
MVYFLAAICSLLGLLVCAFIQNSSYWYLAFAGLPLLGLGDSGFNTQIYATMAHLFPDRTSTAFACSFCFVLFHVSLFLNTQHFFSSFFLNQSLPLNSSNIVFRGVFLWKRAKDSLDSFCALNCVSVFWNEYSLFWRFT